MTQNNLYMENDEMKLYVDVQPLLLDEIESSRNAAVASAASAAQSETNARNLKNSIADYKTSMEIFYAQASDGLTNLYNNSISELSLAKHNTLNTIENSKRSVLNDISTNGQNYISQVQNIVDNRVSLEHLNSSKCLSGGEEFSDADAVAEIKNYAHSTFDKSKFTVIGSPVITDDGIASGFSSSNYLRKSAFIPLTFNKLVIKCEFKTSIVTAYDGIFSLYTASQAQKINLIFNYNKISLSSGNTIFATLTSTSNWVANTEYSANVEIDTTLNKIFVDIYNPDGTAFYSNSTSFTTALDTTKTFSLLLGIQSGAVYPLTNGSIDLKQFSITVDGVELFSGNKTGVDTIKPDDYTEQGSGNVSIIGSGIAKGFTENNYFYADNLTALSGAKEVMLETAVTVPQCVPVLSDIRGIALRCGKMGVGINYRTNKAGLICSIPTGPFYATATSSEVDYGTGTYIVQGIFSDLDTNTPKMYCRSRKIDSDIWTNSNIQTFQQALDLANQRVNIGIYGRADDGYKLPFSYGSMDMNLTKVYVDGVLVYQPCLKIPYTESKTGSKVVDSIYYERVKDLSEQGYIQKYYVLDEDNVKARLPIGDIYGMIENLRKLIMERTTE